MRDDIVIIGGGLAGSEAAWQAANRGARVTLYEMRPKEMTQAHKTGGLAELVCSNSLGSADFLNAPGILKEEMRHLNSLIIRVADEVRVPAGSSVPRPGLANNSAARCTAGSVRGCSSTRFPAPNTQA